MKNLIAGIFLAIAVASCGSGSSPSSRGLTSTTIGGTGGASSSSSSSSTSSSSGVAAAISLGSGTGASFSAGVIGLSATSIAAGGSATLTVDLVDQNDVPYTQSATINFTSSCISQGLSEITDGHGTVISGATTTTGSVTVTYLANGSCSGPDVITATTAVNGVTLPAATGTITVQPSALGSVSFVSASPTTIGLKGTGIQETSTVVFQVTNASGGAVNGAAVTFSLSTSAGGLSLSSTTATSGVDGKVQTVVQSGTVHTSVSVTATATLSGVTVSTQSGNLAVTTGVPTNGSFSLSNTCSNVEAWGYDGVPVAVTVRLADRYNNPVTDGTAVTFQTDGGKIDGACSTGTTTTESGVCTVNWTSQDPRPANGRAVILATTTGEDSFVDTNSNGYYDVGETYTDKGEPYEDDNENGAYDLGEPYIDFNLNGVRDASYGSFKGITCDGSTPGSTCTLSEVEIGGNIRIVMSTSAANVTGPASITGAANAYIPVTYNIQDLHGNAMPNGTTIVVSSTATAGTLDSPSSFVVPCDAGTGGTNITVFLTIPSKVAPGGLIVTVTSPKGLITIFRTAVN